MMRLILLSTLASGCAAVEADAIFSGNFNVTRVFFTGNFNETCLDNLDENATRDARAFVADNVREERWDSNALSMLYFVGLVLSMQMSQVPDPSKTKFSGLMFALWAFLQFLLVIAQVLGILFVLLSYISMKKHFGPCMMHGGRRVRVPIMDLTTALCGVWMPSVLHRLLFLEVVLLTTLDGLWLVKFPKCMWAVNYMLKMPLDMILVGAGLVSFIGWVLTLSVFFVVPLIGIPLVNMVFLAAALKAILLAAGGWQELRVCCRRGKQAKKKPDNGKKQEPATADMEKQEPAPGSEQVAAKESNELENNESQQSLLSSVVKASKWIRTGIKPPRDLEGVRVLLETAAVFVPRFAYLGLFSMALAPGLTTSTWWAWQVYAGQEDATATLARIYEFCLLSFLQGITWPSVADITELVNAVRLSQLVDSLRSLGRELEVPQILLQRSRTWGALGAFVSVLKATISTVEQIMQAKAMASYVGCNTYETLSLSTLQDDPARLSERRYTARQLRAAGVSINKTTWQQVPRYSVPKLREGGFPAKELKEAGYTAKDLRGGGYKVEELEEAGYPDADVKSAYTVHDLKQFRDAGKGYLPADLLELGHGLKDLKSAGYLAGELRNAGVTAADAFNVCGFTLPELQQGEYPAKDACEFVDQDQVSLADVRAAGYKAGELREAGRSEAELKQAGYSVAEQQASGSTIGTLKEAGYTPAELAHGTFPVADMRIIGGCSAKEVLEAKHTVVDMRQGGYSLQELHAAGCNLTALKEAQYTAKQLKDEVGCTAKQLKDVGYELADLQSAQYDVKELKDADVSAEQMKVIGYMARQLMEAGYTTKQLNDAGYTAKELKDADCSAKQLREAGYAVEGLKDAGFGAEQMKSAGYDVEALKHCYSVTDLKGGGFKAPELRQVGCAAKELKDSGFGLEELREAGYSDEELQDAGFPSPQSSGPEPLTV